MPSSPMPTIASQGASAALSAAFGSGWAMTHRILILGGTTEARQLAERLAARDDLAATVSLAGRVKAIVPHPVPIRVGGFGGAEGLAAYLAAEHVDLLVDATHPFADQISRNAVKAAAAAGVSMLALRRAPWAKAPGDRWQEVDDISGAVAALGLVRRRVFLALGRQEVAAFAPASTHFYLVRSIDPIEGRPLADAAYVEARGPFEVGDERALMEAHGIDTLVARNSGGLAGYGKIAAARALGLPVVLIRPPALGAAPAVESVDAAVEAIDHPEAWATPRGE